MLLELFVFYITLNYNPVLCFNLDNILPNPLSSTYNNIKCHVSSFCDPCQAPKWLPKSLDINTLRYNIKTEISINRQRTSTTFKISGKGLPKTLSTLWLVFDPNDYTNEIFKYALHTTPVASTIDAFTNGRNPKKEPNYIDVDRNGDFYFEKTVDFNIFRKLQTPLVGNNVRLQDTWQQNIEDISTGFMYKNLQQPKFKGLNGEKLGYSGISTEYLREFNENGVEKVDNHGNIIITRANLLPRFLIIATHIDNRTHGMLPGFSNMNAGDHWDVTIYDLYTVDSICLGD